MANFTKERIIFFAEYYKNFYDSSRNVKSAYNFIIPYLDKIIFENQLLLGEEIFPSSSSFSYPTSPTPKADEKKSADTAISQAILVWS